MPDQNMINKVAQSLFELSYPDCLLSDFGKEFISLYSLHAKTAIMAMREPTELMKMAGSIDPGSGGPDLGYETEVWQAAIDACLQ